MSNHRIKAGVIITALIITIMFVVALVPPNTRVVPSVPTGKAQFVLASWSYPDEYGQGIYGLRFYENSTAAWVAAPYYIDGSPFFFLHSYDPYILNWSEGVAMKLRVYSLFNQTHLGIESTSEGQKYLRHDVTVSYAYGVVFSQQNFTYYDVTEFGEENYEYEYEVVLNFLPVSGEIYIVTINYEIYW